MEKSHSGTCIFQDIILNSPNISSNQPNQNDKITFGIFKVDKIGFHLLKINLEKLLK